MINKLPKKKLVKMLINNKVKKKINIMKMLEMKKSEKVLFYNLVMNKLKNLEKKEEPKMALLKI